MVAGIVQSVDADPTRSSMRVRSSRVSIHRRIDAQLREAESALVHAQVDVRAFEADVWDAQAQLARAEALSVRQILSRFDLNSCRTALDEATARLSAGQARRRPGAGSSRSRRASTSRAHDHPFPVDGIVVERNGVAGQMLALAGTITGALQDRDRSQPRCKCR